MFQEVLIGCLVLLVTFIAVSLYCNKPRGMPPGPTPMPILGNLLDVIRWTSNKNLHLELENLAKRYHRKVFTLQLPNQNIVVVNSAKTAREALQTKRDDFSGRPYQFTLNYLLNGATDVATSDPDQTWVMLRKIVQIAIRSYQPTLENKLKIEVDELSKKLRSFSGAAVDVSSEITISLFNILCAMVFGNRYELDDPEFTMVNELIRSVFNFATTFNILNVCPLLIHLPIHQSKLLKETKHRFDTLLKQKYNEHKHSYCSDNIRDLTDALIKALDESQQEDHNTYNLITEDHVVMTPADVFIGGYDSTATRLLWYVLYMVRYQDIQAKVQAELDSIVGRDRLPSWNDRKELPYTMASIEETLRRSTAAPVLFPRKAMHNSTLEGYTIPKNTTILVNNWSLHFDENEWDSPREFKPERFLDADGKLVHVACIQSLLSFGAGRRSCIGEALAKQTLFIVLTHILHQFYLRPETSQSLPSIEGDLRGRIIYPKPYKVRFQARQ